MPIVPVLVTIIIVGVCLYLVQAYVPMAAPIKTVLTVVVVLLLCLWLINIFGVFNYSIPIRR